MEAAITERKSLNVFVTGAGSAVGLGVVKALVDGGHKVTGTITSTDEAAAVRARGGLPINVYLQRQSEVESAMRMAKPDVVVNLGTQHVNQVPFADVDWKPAELLASTVSVYEAAAAAGAKFFVQGSFAFVYGNQHGKFVDETARSHADSDVLKAALRAEKAVLTGALPACVLRFGYVYGAESPALVELIDTLRKGRAVAQGTGILNWVYASDAGEAVRRAVEAQPTGDIFNIVDNTPSTPVQFLEKVTNSLGVRPAGRLPNFMTPKAKTEMLGYSSKALNGRARDVLGWLPQYPDQTHGMEDLLLANRVKESVR